MGYDGMVIKVEINKKGDVLINVYTGERVNMIKDSLDAVFVRYFDNLDEFKDFVKNEWKGDPEFIRKYNVNKGYTLLKV